MDKRIFSALLLAAGALLAGLGLFLKGEEGGPLPAGSAPPFVPAREVPPPDRPLPEDSLSRKTPASPKKEKKGYALTVETRSLQGKEGLPLAGIAVRVLGPKRRGLGEEPAPVLARGRTDQKGTFLARSLPPPPWTVEVAGREWALARCTLSSLLRSQREATLVFRLRPGWTLEGRVAEKDSALPLPGVLVKALPLPGGGGHGPLLPREARTAKDGSFHLEGLSQRASYRLRLQREGFEERSLPGPYRKGTPFLNLWLKPLSPVRVILLPPAGAALPTRVELGLLAGREGEEGTFHPQGLLRTCPWPKGGSLTLPCPGPGFYRVRARSRDPGRVPLAGTSPVFRVEEKQEAPPTVTVPLFAGALLQGRVLDGPGGAPLEGVLLWVRGEWRKTRTGPDGKFRLPCGAGDGKVLVLRIPGER
ncbi:MAG TPA: carboxypeptidase regulatory-like domain-containing protein, partial [Planctomycetes bacterium]|nr:carboxypeptidase regulatory-like domain-containing protein [Planctomycetota bacterium]